MGRRIKFEKHETSLFLLTSDVAKSVIKTQDQFMTQEWSRPDHGGIYYFNLRRVQDANMVFHQSGRDAIILNENTPAGH